MTLPDTQARLIGESTAIQAASKYHIPLYTHAQCGFEGYRRINFFQTALRHNIVFLPHTQGNRTINCFSNCAVAVQHYVVYIIYIDPPPPSHRRFSQKQLLFKLYSAIIVYPSSTHIRLSHNRLRFKLHCHCTVLFIIISNPSLTQKVIAESTAF